MTLGPPFTTSRRDMLRSLSCGFGYLTLAGLCAEQARADELNPLAARAPHIKPRAKRVIFLFMQGGPSHVDLFDYKPRLDRDDGKLVSQVVEKFKEKQGDRKLMRSKWKFSQHGQSGLPISDLWPNLSQHADDLCLINSMVTDLPNHPQAKLQLHTGNSQFVRPSMGAWVLYGLGTANQQLPGFISINPISNGGGAQNFGSAFLPASYQASRIGGDNQPLADAKVAHIANAKWSPAQQRKQLDYLQVINRDRLARDTVNTELEGVIESYELAFRMQTAMPGVMDLGNESKKTLEEYGIGGKDTDNFGRQCLLARRFAEAGVRFIELSHFNWDQHTSLSSQHAANARAVDKPIAALITDLKRRGLLDDTLILWGGEFGRTPFSQGNNGRDHNATGFSMWLAGGGVKGGLRYGATDDYGINVVKDKVHVHDLHATILHLLGLDHERLTYRYSGRDFRLTDVHGNVVSDIVA